ncbi:hypothetical protein BH09PLA1_BH09PLA1_05150 [soil metagenome]
MYTSNPPHPTLVEALEPRRLLSVVPATPAQTLPFQRIVLDPNQNGEALEKAFADIDGDGRMDAVIGQRNGIGIQWYSFPASGVPTQPWQKYNVTPTGDSYEDLIIKDVNGDGVVDVIAGINNQVWWYENPRGHGGNPRTENWVAHQIGNFQAHDFVIGDFDRDGKFDIAANTAIYFQNNSDSWTTVSGANYSRAGTGVALLDIGEGRFGPTPLPQSTGGRPGNIIRPTGNLPIDLVGSGPASGAHAIYWYENPLHHNGNPRTDPWIRHYVGPVFDPNYSFVGYCYEMLDVNRDGRVDILAAQGEQPNDFAPPPVEGISWWEAPLDRRNGTWIKHTISSSITNVHRMRVGDVNLDGLPDLVIAEQEQSPADRVAVLYNLGGSGDVWAMQVLSTGSGHNINIADIDGAGDLDFINSPHGLYGAAHPIEIYVNGLRTPASSAPLILKQPSSATVQAGQSTTLVVATRGATPMSYQWTKNGADIAGAMNSYLTISNANIADDGAQYAARITNPLGSLTSDAATLSVTPVTSVFVSDLNPTFQSNGYGPYERDRSNGENGANDGHTITLNGVTYAKGLGVHAASELRYALGGQFQSFSADVGVDDEVGSAGSIVFQVWTDGTKIYDSGTMTGTTVTRSVSVSVAGKNEIRLIVTDAGNGNNSDHGDWANARLIAASVIPGALVPGALMSGAFTSGLIASRSPFELSASALARVPVPSIWQDQIEPDDAI